ncbi:efflux RND transporter periplasmic adaptor subunit, partial [bacterium]|nr:efflux RND transporter periplasmic adaptor subunit [candidate division CSSED10-310 bacterium]
SVYLGAVEGGRVEEIFVEPGTMVKKGDRILRLSNTSLLLDIMYREAELFQQSNNLRNTRLSFEQNRLSLKRELADVEYQLQRAKRLFERNSELYQEHMISDQEYEESHNEFVYLSRKRELVLETSKIEIDFRQQQIVQLEQSLEQIQSNLDIVKQKLENMIVKAPIDGQLTSLDAEIGESKSPGERLGVIDDINRYKVEAEIDEHFVNRIEIGRFGTFELSDRMFQLQVKKVYPEVRNGRFAVDLSFDDELPEDIRRGQTLHIRLNLGDPTQAILLARGGFYQNTGGNWVYVLNETGECATKRQIRLNRKNTSNFEVMEGLQPGEQVITSSYDQFGDMERLILK